MSCKDFPKHQEVNKHMQEKLSLPKAILNNLEHSGEIGGCSNRSRHCPLGRLLERFVFIFNCSYVCVCLCVAVFMCSQWPQMPEEGAETLELESPVAASTLRWVLGTELCPVQQQSALLTSEAQEEFLLSTSKPHYRDPRER